MCIYLTQSLLRLIHQSDLLTNLIGLVVDPSFALPMFNAAISTILYNRPINASSFGVAVRLHMIDAAHTMPVTTDIILRMKSITNPLFFIQKKPRSLALHLQCF